MPRDEAAQQLAMVVAERRYVLLHYFDGRVNEYRDNLYASHSRFSELLLTRDSEWNQGTALAHYKACVLIDQLCAEPIPEEVQIYDECMAWPRQDVRPKDRFGIELDNYDAIILRLGRLWTEQRWIVEPFKSGRFPYKTMCHRRCVTA